MNYTAIAITAIICVTVGFIFWLGFQDNQKGGRKQ
jgi:hypothetical protein